MKNVLITGGTRGLGFAIAKEFLKADCNITICSRYWKNLESCKEQLKEYDKNVLYVQCSVSESSEVEKLWSEAMDKWGSVDIWINNAGQNCPYEYVWDTEDKYVEQVIDTNIKGIIYGSKIAAKNMIEQGSGQIWNMEGLGSNDVIIKKTILYGTSKRALTYFTQAMAKELESTPVKIGRLSPGMMLTDFMKKSPEGNKSKALEEESFKKIFNILGDKPETVAAFLVPRILKNTKNNAHIEWLTKSKSTGRFITAPFSKRKLID